MKKRQKVGFGTKKWLLALGIPAVFIPGLLLAILLGWNPTVLSKVTNYYQVKQLFPAQGVVRDIVDGDTFILNNGVEVRMLGVNAPGRGEKGFEDAKNALATLTKDKRTHLEYDRYQDDKYGRVLAWVWVDCETNPTFLPADYMHLSDNASRDGLKENPEGCKKGKLVNEAMVDGGWATPVSYTDRGPLKYQKRMNE